MLQPQIFEDYEAMSQFAADCLVDRLRRQPGSLLCLATGSTPLRAYELLRQRSRAEPALHQQLRVIKLDEWGGLPAGNPATCEYHLQNSLLAELSLGDRYVGFASQPADPLAECARIREWLTGHGPIDLCVLGLGLNGHLGFNEPGALLTPHAHLATLSTTSLTHAMLAATDQRPGYGLTLGIADLCRSREILLLVAGEAKRRPLQRLLDESISTEFPASLLHLHPRVQLLCDAAAATLDPT